MPDILAVIGDREMWVIIGHAALALVALSLLLDTLLSMWLDANGRRDDTFVGLFVRWLVRKMTR